MSYTVYCSVAGVMQFHIQLKPILEIILDELTPSTNYSCSIGASTSGGDGPFTDSVSASTEGKNVLRLWPSLTFSL